MRDTLVALLLACVPLVLLRVCARAGTEHGDARDRTDGFGEGLGGEQVDRYTAKMRKRLFAKMAADGAVFLKEGQAKATTGLGGAELDIIHYPGPCCVYVRARCGAPSSGALLHAAEQGYLAPAPRTSSKMLAQQRASS